MGAPASTILMSGPPNGEGNFTSSNSVLVYSQDFNGPSVPAGVYATGAASAVIFENALRLSYPANAVSTESFGAMGIDLSSLNTRNIYVKFRARMPDGKWGNKFFKVFGKKTTTNTLNDTYANCTIGPYYSTCDLTNISFGDGTSLENDAQNAIWLEGGSQPNRGARNAGATILTPKGQIFASTDWGTGWHDFEIGVKQNSGDSPETQTNDGEFILRIDGETYVYATGLYNRPWQSSYLEYFELGGWTQGANPAFILDYDTLRASTGGFLL